ncbi:phage tail tube protein [Acuticoccus sediminis]|uniref:phage tail tube protein n=1 Tax=Acuticoccus sediminis TaxID=2184697 RepID=UPI001CFE1E39|nr:phage tail tube protein [Acuticoccus sediminis]
MTTNAAIGYGTLFGISDDGGTSYDTLAEVTSVTPPGSSVDIIDATHMLSPDKVREFIEGLKDPGECSLEMNFIPGATTADGIIRGLSGVQKLQITFPGGFKWQFDGILTGYEPEAPVDDKMTATVTFKVTSSVLGVAGA